MDRRNLRVEAIKIIYEILLRDDDLLTILKEKEVTDEELSLLVTNVLEKRTELEEIIKINLKKYTINRLNLVDLAILLLATYELKYSKTPKAIIINEALDISKIYTQTDFENTVSFNNKLLDNIAKYLEV